MSPYDNLSRIHKKAFLVSTLTLFALCMISTCARFFIRIRIHKSFSIDDGILLFGIGCLISGMVILLTIIDKLYLVEAVNAGVQIELPPDVIEQAFAFHKFSVVALILSWCSIVAVKFSYLFLFRKLIDRMPRMITYWWVAVAFNGLISAYGTTVYVVTCPYFYNLKELQCSNAKGVRMTVAISISQMVLDIAGDLLILFIPFRLIWKIKARRTQKLVLGASLCLTILTIVCTITRIAGINTGRLVKTVDVVWETYWQFIAANIALTMTAATAFRTFFVSRVNDRRVLSPGSKDSWYTKGKRLLWSAFSLRTWRSQPRADSSGYSKKSIDTIELDKHIPRGTMTGIRTFISGQGKTKAHSSGIMRSTVEEEYGDSWPLSTQEQSAGEINVQHDMVLVSENVC